MNFGGNCGCCFSLERVSSGGGHVEKTSQRKPVQLAQHPPGRNASLRTPVCRPERLLTNKNTARAEGSSNGVAPAPTGTLNSLVPQVWWRRGSSSAWRRWCTSAWRTARSACGRGSRAEAGAVRFSCRNGANPTFCLKRAAVIAAGGWEVDQDPLT